MHFSQLSTTCRQLHRKIIYVLYFSEILPSFLKFRYIYFACVMSEPMPHIAAHKLDQSSSAIYSPALEIATSKIYRGEHFLRLVSELAFRRNSQP